MLSADLSFGLPVEATSNICQIFAKFPQIEKVIIYGSRAKGTQRASSDIDLSIIGSLLSFSDFLKVSNELDDLLLPWKIDLSLFHQIENKALIDHINRAGKVLFVATKQ